MFSSPLNDVALLTAYAHAVMQDNEQVILELETLILSRMPDKMYSGPRPNLEQYFMRLLPLLASRGTCIRRKVAAIVTDEQGHLLGCGYNGPPPGAPHCIDTPCPGANDPHGQTSRCQAIHAEENALFQAGPRLAQASRLYCSCTPCLACAKLITAANKIKKVFAFEVYTLEGVKWLLDHKVEVYHVQPDGHLITITEAYFDPK